MSEGKPNPPSPHLILINTGARVATQRGRCRQLPSIPYAWVWLARTVEVQACTSHPSRCATINETAATGFLIPPNLSLLFSYQTYDAAHTPQPRDAELKEKTIHIRMAGIDAPEVSLPLPHTLPIFVLPPIPRLPASTNSPWPFRFDTGSAFWLPGAALCRRRPRVAQKHHQGSPDQMPTPPARPVPTRCCPPAPPTSQLVAVDTDRCDTQSPARDDPDRLGRSL